MSEAPALPAVLLVGEADHSEFAAPLAWLRRHTRLTIVPTVEQGLARCIPAREAWQCIVLAQARPGQLPAAAVEALGRAAPLTPLVALLGSCCEGETRSGKPWPGVVRVYWHQWLARAPGELLDSRGPSTWQLPKTSSDAERVDAALRQLPPRAAGRIVLHARPRTFHAVLAEACRLAGYETVSDTSQGEPRGDAPRALLWHGGGLEPRDLAALRALRNRWPRVPVVALCGFPRLDQVHRAADDGVAAVISLPFLLPDLWRTLQSVTSL